jgi:hypothetical protein
MAITRKLNELIALDNSSETDRLETKLNNAEAQRNEALMKLVTAEEHIKGLVDATAPLIAQRSQELGMTEEEIKEQLREYRTVEYASGDKVLEFD